MKRQLIFAWAVLGALTVFAKIELGTPFSDGVVLQRGMKVPVWGRVVPDTEGLPPPSKGGPKIVVPGPRRITVSFAGQKKSVDADPVSGQWKVELDSMEASKESRTLTVSEERGWWIFGSAGDVVEVKDVLVGEVWFASGQSNMAMPIWNANNNPRFRDGRGAMAVAMTRLPCVRVCQIALRQAASPVPFSSSRWIKLMPEEMHGVSFSAVGFYFARELYLALDIPIAVVNASWNGSGIDSWIPKSGLVDCDPSIAKVYAAGKRGESLKYNGMVASWAPMAMRGFLWYQGCHDDREGDTYCAKLHALYNGWSRDFANPKLRIYLVQLAPWNTNWMPITTAQDQFVREEPNAAIAVVSDAGNFDDIHPNTKEIVAKRLALHALKRDYGFAIDEDNSPLFKSVVFKGGTAYVTFDHAKGLYVYNQKRVLPPEAPFELAGTNGVWHAAQIVNFSPRRFDVVGPKVQLRSRAVPQPVRVRYMGKDRTMGTLFNEMSLPLGPFETK